MQNIRISHLLLKIHFAHFLSMNLCACANASKYTTICGYITKKITLKSANWTENSAKTFFFAHILHVLHLPRYTLNKILSVNCALLELLCKKIYFTPPFIITSLGTTLPVSSNMLKIIHNWEVAAYLNFMNYFRHISPIIAATSLSLWKVHLYPNIPYQIFNILTSAQAKLNG